MACGAERGLRACADHRASLAAAVAGITSCAAPAGAAPASRVLARAIRGRRRAERRPHRAAAAKARRPHVAARSDASPPHVSGSCSSSVSKYSRTSSGRIRGGERLRAELELVVGDGAARARR